MAHNKLYRNFIILQEDERGYSQTEDKALSGYAKVEAKGDKCKISFYAQNLRQNDKYSMVLICCKRDLKQLIDIGPLAINEVGKGDTSKEYYVNNIAGLGISYEKISGAAICITNNNEIEFIMHGFMNGEESAENWRKFKVVKVDSKKGIDKTAVQGKDKNNINTMVNKNMNEQIDKIDNKVVIEQINKVDNKTITEHIDKAENKVVELKNEEIDLQPKWNIDSKGEDNKDRILENNPNIIETIDNLDNLDEDRNKNKDCKKCEKDDKKNKNSKYDLDKCKKEDKKEEKKDKCDLDKYKKEEKENKCDKCCKDNYKKNEDEKEESAQELLDKLDKKLENDYGLIDIQVIHNVYKDVIIFGFIKDKKDHDCKWKKFKLEKKCRSVEENESVSNEPISNRRIEENFKLDKLNDVDRLDSIDFDEYENNIGKSKIKNVNLSDIDDKQDEYKFNKKTKDYESIWQPWSENNNKNAEGIMGDLEEGYVAQEPNVKKSKDNDNTNKKAEANKGFTITGDIGIYFEKVAKDFKEFEGNLNDINFCKWYKIIVNSIDDLSDESNYNQYTLAYYPMLNYYPYISKTGHYLLGYKCDKDGEMQYIIYAIPGSKEKSDQPYGGRTGFVTWTCDDNSNQGYWLMFYDFKNSSIVIPKR